MKLSEEQLAAVTRSGQDVCVVAGPAPARPASWSNASPGSWNRAAPPAASSPSPFTEKAAAEIKQRLLKRFPDEERQIEIERAPVSTVHGFCARFLRSESIRAALDPAFSILTEPESETLLLAGAEQTLNELLKADQDALLALCEAWDSAQRAPALVSAYRAARNEGRAIDGWSLSPVQFEDGWSIAKLTAAVKNLTAANRDWFELRDWLDHAANILDRPGADAFAALDLLAALLRTRRRGTDSASLAALRDRLLPAARRWLLAQGHEPHRQSINWLLRTLHHCYAAAKRDRAALDFQDLQERSIALLESSPALRAEVQAGFDAILMDELQDTNPVQWRLVNLVRRPHRFFGVGDRNQSIYSFLQAEPALFGAFRESVLLAGGEIDWLRTNYRSRPEILAATQLLLGQAPGIETHQMVAGSAFRPKDIPSVEIIVAEGEGSAEGLAIEASWVARRIQELVGSLRIDSSRRLLRYQDVAVLVKASTSLPEFEQAFEDAAVPFTAQHGSGFFDRQEVCDLLNLLRVLANPADELPLLAVLRSPLLGMADDSLLALRRLGPLGSAFLSPQIDLPEAERERFDAFRDYIREWSPLAGTEDPALALEVALDRFDYRSGLAPAALASLGKLIGLVRAEFHDQPNLPALLDRLAERRVRSREPAAIVDDSRGAVQVMTMHAAKGLEFPVVFLAALHRGSGGRAPALTYSEECGLGARWHDPWSGQTLGDAQYEAEKERNDARQELEADRLLYVAMTRAEEHLILSHAVSPRSRSRWPALLRTQFQIRPADFTPDPTPWTPPAATFPLAVRRVQLLAPPLDQPAPSEPTTDRTSTTFELLATTEPPCAPPPRVTLAQLERFALCPRQYWLLPDAPTTPLTWHPLGPYAVGLPPTAPFIPTRIRLLLADWEQAYREQFFPPQPGAACYSCPAFRKYCPGVEPSATVAVTPDE